MKAATEVTAPAALENEDRTLAAWYRYAPAELPVQAPAKYVLTINLALADEVIE
jgi:hypothetical protein